MSTEEELEEAAFRAQMLGEAIEPAEADDDESPPEPEQDELPEPERVEIIPGYTKEEFDNVISDIPRVRSALDKAQGTYGQKMQALQAEIDQLKAARPANITLSKLEAEYPDLARLLAEDLQSGLPSQPSAQPVDFTAYKNELDEKIATFNRNLALKQLESVHSDYREIATWSDNNDSKTVVFNDMKFGNWIAQQTKEVQNVVLTSDDPNELSKVLTDYKKAAKSTPNLDVIRDAVQPRSIPTTVSAKSDDELEEEAFRAEMKKHIR